MDTLGRFQRSAILFNCFICSHKNFPWTTLKVNNNLENNSIKFATHLVLSQFLLCVCRFSRVIFSHYGENPFVYSSSDRVQTNKWPPTAAYLWKFRPFSDRLLTYLSTVKLFGNSIFICCFGQLFPFLINLPYYSPFCVSVLLSDPKNFNEIVAN